MAEKKRKWWIFGVAGILGLFGLMGAAAAADGNDEDRRNGNGRGTTKPKPDGGGKRWGPPKPKDGFNPGGAGILISDDCMTVIEGARFWPDPVPDIAERYSTGSSCLINSVQMLEDASDPRCSALDLVEFLTQEEGYDPILIAQRILRDASPVCADADPATWGDGLFSWYNDLVDRLTDYVPDFQDYAEG